MNKEKPNSIKLLQNSNNNSNKSYFGTCEDSKDMEYGELGEIRPQTTCEGYGLRTPYGTHFNLDFMKYCQNFGREARLNSSSNKGCTPAGDVTSQSAINDVLDSEGNAESTLWETRRRLDMFRSYRKRTFKSGDFKSQSGHGDYSSLSTECSSNEDLTISEPDLTFPVAKRPLQEQNLQAVREQMAKALKRLKYLENEAKKIPILKVQISVLQQEKEKMAKQLRDSDGTAKICAKKITSPPPPPERKYRSIAIGTNGTKATLGLSVIHVEGYVPEKETSSCSTEVSRKSYKDSSIFMTAATQTDVFPMSHNIPMCNHKSTQAHPTSADFSVNTHMCGVFVETQTYCESVNSTTSTHDLLHPATNRSTNTESFTIDKSVSFKPITSDFACYARLSSGIDVKSNTDVSCATGVTTVMQCDVSIQCCPTLDDVGVNTSCVMTDASVSANLRGNCKDASIQSCPMVADVGVNISCVMADASVSAKLRGNCKDASIQSCPMVADVGVNNSHVMADASVSATLRGNCKDASIQNCPMVADVGVNISRVMADASVSANLSGHCKDTASQIDSEKRDFGILAKKCVVDFSCNTEKVDTRTIATDFDVDSVPEAATVGMFVSGRDFPVHFQPVPLVDAVEHVIPVNGKAHAEVRSQKCDVKTGITATDESMAIEGKKSHLQLDFFTQKFEEVEYVASKDADVRMCDASTDTSDLAYPPWNNVDVGTYVGQVESLLVEQQALLIHEYKELGVVLDSIDATPTTSNFENKKICGSPNACDYDQTSSIKESPPCGYRFSSRARDACNVITLLLSSEDKLDSAAWADSREVLCEEWFRISSPADADPRNINCFSDELLAVSTELSSEVINSLDTTGNSALHYAVSHQNFDVIGTLVDIHGFNVNQYNKAGYTASMLAAITNIDSDNDMEILSRLFQNADVCLHARDAQQTALMLAVSHGCVSTAKLLLSAGADVNARDEDGSTALMCATEHGHIELVKTLLAHPECDPNITDNDGGTAMDIAMDNGQHAVGMLLYVHLNLDRSKHS